MQEFIICSKKVILKTILPKINCTTYNIKEIVDPEQVLISLITFWPHKEVLPFEKEMNCFLVKMCKVKFYSKCIFLWNLIKVKLPECTTKKIALSTVQVFTDHIDDYQSRTSEFGCPIPCEQKRFKYTLEYFSNFWAFCIFQVNGCWKKNRNICLRCWELPDSSWRKLGPFYGLFLSDYLDCSNWQF